MVKKLFSFLIFIVMAVVAAVIIFLFLRNEGMISFDVSEVMLVSPETDLDVRKIQIAKENNRQIAIVFDNIDKAGEKAVTDAAAKLYALKNIVWYSGSGDDPESLESWIRSTAYYRNPDSVPDISAAALAKRLDLLKSSVSVADAVKTLKKDPLLIMGGFNLDGVTDGIAGLVYPDKNDHVCQGKVCGIMYGVFSENADFMPGTELRAKLDKVLAEYSSAGGSAHIASGFNFEKQQFFHSALHDICIIWPISIFIVLLVCIFLYHSLRPFSGLIIVNGIAWFIAVITVAVVYDRIHMMTILMTAPLFAAGIDIYLGFYSQRMSPGVKHYFNRAQLLAIFVTMTCFLAMLAVNCTFFDELSLAALVYFPVLIVLIYGLLNIFPVRKDKRHKVWLFNAYRKFRYFAVYKFIACLVSAVLIGIALYGFTLIRFSDNPLNGITDKLSSENSATVEKGQPALNLFMVYGETGDVLGSRLYEIRTIMENEGRSNGVSGIYSYSSILPPDSRSIKWHAEYAAVLQQLKAVYEKHGFADLSLSIPDKVVYPVADFSTTPYLKKFTRVLDSRNIPYVSTVIVKGGDPAWLDSISQKFPYVENGSFHKEFSADISDQQSDLLFIMLFTALLCCAVILFFYGMSGVLGIMLPPVAGVGFSCLYAALSVGSCNVFVTAALLLVACTGADFGIFTRHAVYHDERRAVDTVILSFIMSLCLFGALGFSAIPGISIFGITAAVGLCPAVLIAFVFNLFAAPKPAYCLGKLFKGKKNKKKINKPEEKETEVKENEVKENVIVPDKDEVAKNLKNDKE